MVLLLRPGAKQSVYKTKQPITLVEEDLMDLIEHLFSKAITTAAAGATTIIIVVEVFGTKHTHSHSISHLALNFSIGNFLWHVVFITASTF